MSFMFNPYPYYDPDAVNIIDPEGIDLSSIQTNILETAKTLLLNTGNIIGIDGYTTAPYCELLNILGQEAVKMGLDFAALPTDDLWLEEQALDTLLRDNLSEDRYQDPSLLYGKLFKGHYEDLMDSHKLHGVIEQIRSYKLTAKGKLVIYGPGSLSETLLPLYDSKVWIDLVPLQAILNIKQGRYHNIGVHSVKSFKQIARRCYFVDFELAQHQRMRVLGAKTIDFYVAGTDPQGMKCLSMTTLEQIFKRALEYPLRNRPVYLEGVWGGYFFKKHRHLPEKMANCAWIFDMIPMEVSTALKLGDLLLEFPFYCLVQMEGERLMGKPSFRHFGPYFPIRFNYDDTFHSNGNMSIQCHPTREYIREKNGEIDRQDESYYIVEAGQGARTFLGFKDGVDVDQFIADIRQSEEKGTIVNYEHYVNWIDSKPGTQIMIPAGTIHASGRNQVVLEIGSLTVGSYTYKLYDYLREDLDGTPRPLHIYHGDKVLNRTYTRSWVQKNLVQPHHSVRRGDDWEEFIVGEHELLYFSLRNIQFIDKIEDDTKDRFHVLALVNGEEVLIRSKTNNNRKFLQKYLEIVVIPASFGPYEIINLVKGSTVIIHKTILKDGFENDPASWHTGT